MVHALPARRTAASIADRSPAPIHVVPRSVLDFDAPRRGFRLLRNRNLEHTVLAAGADAFGVGGVGQREAPVERTVRALDARELAVLLFAFSLAFAFDRENSVVHVYFDVGRIHTGNIGEYHEALVLFLDIHT